ncbi:MAG TPA: prolipoprotein diacylglyceryl transferase family protein, partial [Patescibacteria group bacterium]|nr:prolipoprotein diacylglyceryl transferase family protein [Patescibacteria group bacterium]
MQLLVLLPAFLLFLYVIYKLVKDDYVFIRKNISLEQMFDVLFITTGVGLLFARLFYFLFHFGNGENIFLHFFSPDVGGLSFFGAFLGGLLTLYFFGKYKKMPLERLFDFFILAFVVALPAGFIGTAFLAKNLAIVYLLGNALVYG